mgnify:CR=1 FL=1
MSNRRFEKKTAKRERVPMLVGLIGPSGSGKTYSALRMASGMAEATGGRIVVIDTEARRALHYADEFTFEHIDMGPPFSPLDYLEAIKFAVDRPDDILIVDSMSHEHEGQGGVLEMHAAEVERMAGTNLKKAERVKFTAWIKPKQERRRLINAVLQLGVNGIFCFRAKEKTKPVAGQQPVHLGWQPIAGEEFVFEMLVNVLLYPGAGGVPNWAPDESSEKIMLKLPKSLAHCFDPGKPISEATGRAIAEWAQGPTEEHAAAFDEMAARLRAASNRESLRSMWPEIQSDRWARDESTRLIAIGMARAAELKQQAPAAEVDPETGEAIPPDAGIV